jgi:F420-dependent oxidoreductase-like protein
LIMHIGLHIGKFDWAGSPMTIGPRLAEIARTADAAGLYSLWVMDHLFQLGVQYGIVHGPLTAPMLEGYSTIAYLAGITRQIRLGTLVTCPLYRHPGLLLKIASTIDVLSGGRTYLGLGAGWFEREAYGLGIPFPPLRERYERLEETLQIARHMWSGNPRPYIGAHYQLGEPLNNPQPLSQPHPPILIGGGGEQKTLRLVAQYADACNFVIGSPLTLEEFGELRARTDSRDERYSLNMLRHKLGVLAEHCTAVGRPYNAIERTVVTYIKLGPGAMSAADVIDLCVALAELGFSHVIFNMPDVHTIRPLEQVGRDIIPAVATLGATSAAPRSA